MGHVMDDVELGRRFEDADPANSRVVAPLTARAMADLGSITAGEFVPRLRRTAQRRSRGKRFAVLATATAILLVGVVAVRVIDPASTHTDAAYAATPPLLAPSGPVLPFTAAIDTSIRRLDHAKDLPSVPVRFSHYEAWFANITFGTAADSATTAVVSAEEDTLKWAPDLSGTITSLAGRSWDPAHNGFAGGEAAATPGTVLRSETFKPGELGVAFPQPPPTDVAAMRERMIMAGWTDRSDPAQLVTTIGELLNEWTLTGAQEAAVLGVVRETPGFESLGTVTDRLGRLGLAFRAPDPDRPSMEEILVISTRTGEIISHETIYLGGLKEFAKVLKAPAVFGYTAWR